MADAMETGIQKLPQELQDYILDLTLTITDGAVEIDKTYKPPLCLHLNRKTRNKNILGYYSNIRFTIGSKTLPVTEFDSLLRLLKRWSHSLQYTDPFRCMRILAMLPSGLDAEQWAKKVLDRIPGNQAVGRVQVQLFAGVKSLGVWDQEDYGDYMDLHLRRLE